MLVRVRLQRKCKNSRTCKKIHKKAYLKLPLFACNRWGCKARCTMCKALQGIQWYKIKPIKSILNLKKIKKGTPVCHPGRPGSTAWGGDCLAQYILNFSKNHSTQHNISANLDNITPKYRFLWKRSIKNPRENTLILYFRVGFMVNLYFKNKAEKILKKT